MKSIYETIKNYDFGKKELETYIQECENLPNGQYKYGCIATLSGCYVSSGKKGYRSGPVVGTLVTLPFAILSIPIIILHYLNTPLIEIHIERKYTDEDIVKRL